LLFDAKVKAGSQPGGTGHQFDWTILANYRGQLPWMLAGGLDHHNVASAIKISAAKAVDVSSGVESYPGKKDAEQIHAFIRAAQLG
jgi:phosphoribosylanthranilate isomerase